jgi:hypothetical protein
MTGMSSVVEEDMKGKRVAYKDMHTLYEAEQKRADRLSGDEAARELKNGENSDWVTKQLKRALDPKDRDTVEVSGPLMTSLLSFFEEVGIT